MSKMFMACLALLIISHQAQAQIHFTNTLYQEDALKALANSGIVLDRNFIPGGNPIRCGDTPVYPGTTREYEIPPAVQPICLAWGGGLNFFVLRRPTGTPIEATMEFGRRVLTNAYGGLAGREPETMGACSVAEGTLKETHCVVTGRVSTYHVIAASVRGVDVMMETTGFGMVSQKVLEKYFHGVIAPMLGVKVSMN